MKIWLENFISHLDHPVCEDDSQVMPSLSYQQVNEQDAVKGPGGTW